jgi:hypothetical protein
MFMMTLSSLWLALTLASILYTIIAIVLESGGLSLREKV